MTVPPGGVAAPMLALVRDTKIVAARLLVVGPAAPVGRCGAITVRADRCRQPGRLVAEHVWLCEAHRCRAIGGQRLMAFGTDGGLWRIGT